ncbi:MAG: hypothetical protein JOZ46_00920 [Candidatus Dormibacteraeota bacterium]|nr:hypothetical protein [Candidatus Dormibacteraeota bacterium]MBV9524355.1 hypothetical protein [Candidatus Dormibacteraeota bacterium]
MTRRPAERGVVRGCCLGVILLLVLLGLSAFVVDRAMAAPDLGAPPGGNDDGETQQAIAVSLGLQLGRDLVTQPHGVVTLTEHDLSVIAAANNPHPDRYHDVSARVRDGFVVVSALTSYGPISTTVVAHIGVALQQGGARLVATVVHVDVGDLPIPGWVQDHFVGSPTIQLDPLFNSNAALQVLRANIECVLVAPDGVRVGVHRPGAAASPGVCGQGA